MILMHSSKPPQFLVKAILITFIVNISSLLLPVIGIIWGYSLIGSILNALFTSFVISYVITAVISLLAFILSIIKLIFWHDKNYKFALLLSVLPTVIFLFILYSSRNNLSDLINNKVTLNFGEKMYRGDKLRTSLSNEKITEIDTKKELIIGKTTLENVQKLLGDDTAQQLSFANNRKKTIADHTFTYDKILHYEYQPPAKVTKTREGGNLVTRSINVDEEGNRGWMLVIFFDDNVISHVLYEHNVIGTSENSNFIVADDSYGWEKSEYIWPGAGDDIKDYKTERGIK